jgi:ABC-type dipeptide/oligopeptide/nickel transport system permease subunit
MAVAPGARSLVLDDIKRPHRSPTQDALRSLFRTRSAIVGMIVLGVLILVAIFAPVIAPYPPNQPLIGVEPVSSREAPCIHLLGCPADRPQHLMGVDGNVRDLFSRMLYGARISLVIGFSTTLFAIFIGTMIGGIAGYAGGSWDNALMRVMDVLLAFPALLLAIAIVTVLGPGLKQALLAIGIVSIPQYARVSRASVLTIKEQEFVTAAHMIGASPKRILWRAILPLTLTPLIVQGTLGIATAILDAAALAFLGLGAQPPDAEWGSMVGAERNQLFTSPHLVLIPGFGIMLTVLAFNLLGDGLRDALDPRLRKV